ncbi:DUF1430 domain-containing protein [Ligilactobacillus sp.]|uniref:DUF1430 domain-containing protein n=1 Tax=Ligilactobacillus sp. TaxID=2767921 RepID=UPI002FE1ECFE
MRRIKKAMIFLAGTVCVILVLLFVHSLGPAYIEPNGMSYDIEGMRGGADSSRFNKVVEEYAEEHDASAIKVFNVPAVSGGDGPVIRIHVYGRKAGLPKGVMASHREFLTSDIRYPLYFTGGADAASIEKMFSRNGIRYSRLNENRLWTVVNFLGENQAQALFLLMLMVLFISLLLTNLRELRKMNICALLGMSNVKEALRDFLGNQKDLLLVYLPGMTAVLFYMEMESFTHAYGTVLYFAALLYLAVTAVMLAAAVARCAMHSRRTISAAVKGNSHSRFSFYVNMTFKAVTEIFVCTTCVSLIGAVRNGCQMEAQLSTWMKGRTYYTVNLAPYAGSGKETHILEQKAGKFFCYLEKHGGMLVNYQGFGRPEDSTGDLFSGNVMTVTAGYLQRNRVMGADGRRILLPADSDTTYVLVPSGQFEKRRQLVRNYRSQLWLNDAGKRMNGKLSVRTLETADDQKLFTYSADALDLGCYSGNAENPVVVVLSEKSLGGISPENVNANSNWLTFISNQSFLCPDVSAIQTGMEKAGLTGWIGSIVNTRSLACRKLAATRTRVRVLTAVLVIALLVAGIETFSFTGIYFSNNRKKIAVKRLLGAGSVQIFGRFAALLVFLSVLEAGISFLITKDAVAAAALSVASSFCGIVILSVQTMLVSRRIAVTLKGE